MRRTLFLALFSALFLISFAQSGKITGKVISATSGLPLSGATLTLSGKTQIADLNGNFNFSGLPAGNYSIRCSYSGHQDKVIDEIVVRDKDNTTVMISLEEKRKTLDSVIITTTRTRAAGESISSLLIAQKNSANVSDGITAEAIRRTPDRSTSDVLKRVSGASIQDERFAIIRGMNDRYNAAFINGAPLPSTESDRKAFAFDIFPSAILDNLIIYKTATPDKTGDFAGGLIDITTKSIPAKNFTSISIGGGFNSLITTKTRQFSEMRGGKDWIGIDDGSRAIPNGIPDVQVFRGTGATPGLTFAKRAELAKLFGNYKWGIEAGNTSPNINFQFSQGLNIERKQREFFGSVFSVLYNRNYTFGEGERNTYEFDLTAPDAEPIQRGKFKDTAYNIETVVGVLANFALKLNNRNSFSWKNNFSINTDNRLIKRYGPTDYTGDSTIVNRDAVRWFTSNQIFSSQLMGEHQVGKVKTRVNWLGSYSKVNREIPNLARTSYQGIEPYFSALINSTNVSQSAGSGSMFFSNLDEDIKSIKADITQPYTLFGTSQNVLKGGAGHQFRDRSFNSRLLGFAIYNAGAVQFDFNLQNLPVNEIYLPQNLGLMANGKGGFLLQDGTEPNANYKASSALTHAYLMNDQRFFSNKLRAIYGVRLERFNQKLNAFRDATDTINLNTVVTDYLPSVNLVYALTPKMNVRLSYAQTVNRPEFRELAPFLFFDFSTQFTYNGLDTLQRSKISNYDFRYEFYPGRAQLFSVSAFLKTIERPIEIQVNPVFDNLAGYSQSDYGRIYGLEAEFRTLISTLLGIKNEQSFFNKLTLAANAAIIESNVELGRFGFFDSALLEKERPLQGQSPYLVNGSLNFNEEKLGFSTTVSVNRVGDRISLLGNKFKAYIYERARTVLDVQVAKFFLKNKLEVRFTARDLLAQNFLFYFDNDKSRSYNETDRVFSSYAAPKIFSLSATYRF
jgi:hypothetical protein